MGLSEFEPRRLRAAIASALSGALLWLWSCHAIENPLPQLGLAVLGDDGFSALVVSGSQVRPGAPAQDPNAGVFPWLASESSREQLLPAGGSTPPPSLVLALGNLTEVGAPGSTWQSVVKLYDSLGKPWHFLPGPRDNAWNPISDQSYARYGGPHHAFEAGGLNFVLLSSAVPQERTPCLDAAGMAWLRVALARLAPGVPVVIAMHHPPDSAYFAQPSTLLEFMDAIDGTNVVALLHADARDLPVRRLASLDLLRTAPTFSASASGATAVQVIALEAGQFVSLYRFQEQGQAPLELLRKSASAPAQALEALELLQPARGAELRGEFLEIALDTRLSPGAELSGEPRVLLDASAVAVQWTRDQQHWSAALALGTLAPGAHQLSVQCETPTGGLRQRTHTFYKAGGELETRWRRDLGAGVRAAPTVFERAVVVGDLSGRVRAFERSTGRELWQISTGGPIVGSPAVVGALLVVGSGDGSLHAIDSSGSVVWRRELGAPVHGAVASDGNHAYVGDQRGRMHCIDAGGEERWVFEGATAAVEAAPLVTGTQVIFAAWDGWVYALSVGDGSLRWKTLGPRAAQGAEASYYAPADSSPVPFGAAGDGFLICDLSYHAGAYDRTGTGQPLALREVAAVGAAAERGHALVRGRDHRLTRLQPDGSTQWQVQVVLGALPVAPTERGGRVWVCSDRGLLSVVSAADGSVQGSLRVTPGAYVMAPVAVDEASTGYVAGMDGSLCAVRARPLPAPPPRPAAATAPDSVVVPVPVAEPLAIPPGAALESAPAVSGAELSEPTALEALAGQEAPRPEDLSAQAATAPLAPPNTAAAPETSAAQPPAGAGVAVPRRTQPLPVWVEPGPEPTEEPRPAPLNQLDEPPALPLTEPSFPEPVPVPGSETANPPAAPAGSASDSGLEPTFETGSAPATPPALGEQPAPDAKEPAPDANGEVEQPPAPEDAPPAEERPQTPPSPAPPRAL